MENLPIGFELELEVPSAIGSNSIVKKAESLINKKLGSVHSDCSLNRGFEFSSNPIVSAEFLNAGCKKWRSFFTKLKRDIPDIEAQSNCGMHVHIGKAAITSSDMIKLDAFIVFNQSFCESVAGRKGDDLYKYISNTGKVMKQNFDRKTNFCGNRDDSDDYKFRAWNVGRIYTIEFRIFAAVTKFKLLMKNMQFVIALVEFVKTCGLSILDFKVDPDKVRGEFLRFVRKNKYKYRYLYVFLIEKMLMAK